MLCKKCYKSIPQSEEIQIENSIICKECAQKPIAKCHTCSKSIYNNEPIRESTKTWVRGFNIWLFLINKGGMERIVQCDECYQEWRSEVKKKGNLLKAGSTILFIFLVIVLLWMASFFYPEITDKLKKIPGAAIFPSFLALFIVLLFFGKFLEIDRYKMKERKTVKKNKKK